MHLASKSVIHLETVWERVYPVCFHTFLSRPVLLVPFVEECSSPVLPSLPPLVSSLSLWRSISGLAILSHSSMFLFSRQHHTVLMSVASQDAMKVGSAGPPTLFSQAAMNRPSPVSHKLGVEQLIFLKGPLVLLPGNPQSQKEANV